MPTLDNGSQAAVASPSFAVAWYVFLDVAGDPIRVTNFGQDTTFSSTGIALLDGYTFVSFGGKFLDIGEVSDSDNGSETLTVTLSGIVSIDTALLNEIGDKTKWQGRDCHIWFRLYDETGVTAQGAVVDYYWGKMASVKIIAAPEQQIIQLSVEKYQAYIKQASNRSYMSQSKYDAADTSAAATLAASNGLRPTSGATPSYGGGNGNGGYNEYQLP